MSVSGTSNVWRIEPLEKKHVRDRFDCGQLALDRYVRQQARQDSQNLVAAAFVAVLPPALTVLGFYSLSSSLLDAGLVPTALANKLPRYPQLPVTLLGRLAVDGVCKGQGLGQHLLLDALHRSWQSSASIAAMAVVVDVKDESARSFYKRYGFSDLNSAQTRLFLPMQAVAKLFA